MPVPGSSKEVARNICGSAGHRLVSYSLSPLYNPQTKEFVPQYETRCWACGLTPKDIFGLRDREQPVKPPKKSKTETPAEPATVGE